MLLVSLGSLLLRPPHIYTPAAASLVRRRAGPLLACGVSGARSLSGTRKEADRLISRAFKKTAKANERATACERKEEAELMAEAAALGVGDAAPARPEQSPRKP